LFPLLAGAGHFAAWHFHNEYGNVVSPTAKVRQMHEEPHRFFRWHRGDDSAHFLWGNLAGQAVAAKQEPVARLNGMRPFNVHFDFRVRTERANDNVLFEVPQFVRVDTLPACNLPHPRMIEGELFGLAVADAVRATVANVSDPRAFRSNDQCGAGRAQPAELR